jgi:RNA ligase (TIGR02306 family)
MLRKLASIQVIESLEPIEGADRILKARVMGWSVVVAKGEFAPGDRCVFFEVDAVLPEAAPWAAFMRPRGFRVKTCTLRGVLSQGLALPLDLLPPDHGPVEVGQEVTEALGVTKYEPEVPLGVEAAGPFPSFIPKSDEIRLQSALGLLDELRGLPFYVTVKCDGTSSTIARLGGELTVCSRNLALKPGENPFWRVAGRYALDALLPEGFAVQGEVCGPKIQKNRLGLRDHDLFVFNVFDVKQGRYLDFADFVAFCRDLRLTTVPVERVVEGDELARFELTLPRLLELAEGTYAGTGNRREGIVVRPLVERRSETLGGSRLSFKVLNNAYLLKDET